MTVSTFTYESLTELSRAAGADISQHGGKARFIRILEPFSSVGDVRLGREMGNLKRGKPVGEAFTTAVNGLLLALNDGSFTPTSTPSFDASLMPKDPEDDLSDEQLLAQCKKRFAIMNRFVDKMIAGKFVKANSLLVTGVGGIGKTYPIERKVRAACPPEGQRQLRMTSGSISPVMFYKELFLASEKGGIVLLDDADAGLRNPEFLNLLKAATDTKASRWVSWKKKSATLEKEGIPNTFKFEGVVIIISNVPLKANAERGGETGAHTDAVLSRAMHIDLGVTSSRALALWVGHMVREERMLDAMFDAAGMSDFKEQAAEEICQFVYNERDSFRAITLREVVKIADMYISEEGDPMWADMVKVSLGSL